MSLASARPLIERFGRMKALVLGDLMLDHFIWGSVSRISPEAPVPVVEVSRETEVPGGAGNVAVNMASLGATVFLVGLLGEDEAADRLAAKFSPRVHTDCALRTADRPTIVKTRIIAHNQQVVRFDRERRGAVTNGILRSLWSNIEEVLPEVDVVVISDYAKGVVEPSLVKQLFPAARRRGIPVAVDPKPENFNLYRRATCVTPNLHEAMECGGVKRLDGEADVEALGRALLKKSGADSILITRGEKGMSLFEKDKPVHHIPTRAREVYDVTGAGDTVISTLSLALAAGAPARIAADLANFAAGIVVGKLGTATVSPQELLGALRTAS
jgi:D-glycero-beta-D-manno-heptose-7-phosphate kinase